MAEPIVLVREAQTDHTDPSMLPNSHTMTFGNPCWLLLGNPFFFMATSVLCILTSDECA